MHGCVSKARSHTNRIIKALAIKADPYGERGRGTWSALGLRLEKKPSLRATQNGAQRFFTFQVELALR